MNLSNDAYDAFLDNFIPNLLKGSVYLFACAATTVFLYTILAYFTNHRFSEEYFNITIANIVNLFISTVMSLLIYGYVYCVLVARNRWNRGQWRDFWMAFAHRVNTKNGNQNGNTKWCEENCKNLWTMTYEHHRNRTIYFFLSKKEALLFKLSCE